MRRFGFTIVEVLVTIMIIGLLATITVYSYGAALERSRDQQRLTDMGTVGNALQQYYLDHKAYPANIKDPSATSLNAAFQLDSLIYGKCNFSGSSLAPSYLTKIPEDPQNKLTVSDNGGQCTASPTTNAGQYLYVADADANPHSYWLMANMERSSNASKSVDQKPIVANFPEPAKTNFSQDPNPQSLICNDTTFDGPSCYVNYYTQPKSGQ